jgi:hypothetical protein
MNGRINAMAYAIVGYFDNRTDSFIQSLWKELADRNVCSYMCNSENNPHIKFSMYTQLDLEKAKSILYDFVTSRYKMNIHLKNYGFFTENNPVLVIDFAPSIQLLDLQKDAKKAFDKCGDKFDVSYFDEGIWMPNCQLSVKNENTNFQEAIHYLLERPLQFNGTLERIGIIEFHPAKQIVSFEFRW